MTNPQESPETVEFELRYTDNPKDRFHIRVPITESTKGVTFGDGVYFRGNHYRVQGCSMENGFPGRWILSVPEFYQKSIPPNFQHCKYPIHDLSNLAAENLPLSVR